MQGKTTRGLIAISKFMSFVLRHKPPQLAAKPASVKRQMKAKP
jgi:RNA:NAD 2'-phosphotransferase (TPT1/KptA family)